MPARAVVERYGPSVFGKCDAAGETGLCGIRGQKSDGPGKLQRLGVVELNLAVVDHKADPLAVWCPDDLIAPLAVQRADERGRILIGANPQILARSLSTIPLVRDRQPRVVRRRRAGDGAAARRIAAARPDHEDKRSAYRCAEDERRYQLDARRARSRG